MNQHSTKERPAKAGIIRSRLPVYSGSRPEGSMPVYFAGAAAGVHYLSALSDYGRRNVRLLRRLQCQQIPFYQMCHDMIRSGETGWNWYTDLGSNFIGSYAFYLMGSPFFWLTIPFPSDAVPYLLAPLMMLKLATAAVTSYGYLKRFVKNPGMRCWAR